MGVQRRARFWVFIGAGVTFTLLFAITLMWPNWLELVFHIEPDEGSGAVEWLIVGVSGATALLCFILTGREWHRTSQVNATSL